VLHLKINKMLETEKLAVPFLDNTSLTKIKSLRFNDKFVFTSTDIVRVTDHVNFRQAKKDAKLIEGKDYIVLERKAQSKELWQQLEELNLVAKRSARITLVYESGFWKMALNCQTKFGDRLREWLSSDVLPSIRETGGYSLSSFVSPQLLIENSKREVQLENSKLVNTKKYEEGAVSDVIKYNIDNCKQVTGSTPVQVKKAYGRPSKSAKDVLREFNPAAAMTMSINDYFVVKQNKDLEMLKDLDTHLLNTFNEMLKIGITLKDE
jgi:hypothetical protein